jgi:hypothetical protein
MYQTTGFKTGLKQWRYGIYTKKDI